MWASATRPTPRMVAAVRMDTFRSSATLSTSTYDFSMIWRRRSFTSFEDAHPKARGWLEAYLPGYSKDGTRAVVRAGVGPWAHAAMLTAVLEKRGDKWTVVWYYVARFA